MNQTDFSTIFPREQQPTVKQISDYIEENTLWASLLHFIHANYTDKTIFTYSDCSMQRGWNIKYKQRGKVLCTLYPKKGYFVALVSIGKKEIPKFEEQLSFFSTQVQKAYQETDLYIGGKWLSLDVKDALVLRDIKKIIALRMEK